MVRWQRGIDSLKCCLGHSPRVGEVFGKEELISCGVSKEGVILLLHPLLGVCMSPALLSGSAAPGSNKGSLCHDSGMPFSAPRSPYWFDLGEHIGLFVRGVFLRCISFSSQSHRS